MDLMLLRKEIDKIDNNLMKILSKRMKISQKIAKFKFEKGIKINSKEREILILKKNCYFSKKYKLNMKFLNNLFKLILAESKNVQKKSL